MRFAAFVLAACGGPALVYPTARTAKIADTLHGERVVDPYRWLEDLGAPETRAWVDAETAVTHRWLAAIPSRPAIARELAAAADFDRIGQLKRRGGRWFFTRRLRGHGQPELVVADSYAGPATTVVDFDLLSAGGTRAYAGFAPSPRGTYVAYGLSSGGSDWVDWHVREVATGRELPDRIAWTKYSSPSWTADETGFYYSRFPEPAAGQELVARDLGCTVRLHRLGGDDDPIVVADPDHPSWQFEAHVTPDGRWLVVTTSDGQLGDRGVEEIHAIDLLGAGALVPIAVGFDAQYLIVGNDGARFFVHTTLDAPTGRVIAIDAANPARERWTTIVPAGTDSIEDVVRSGDRLVVESIVDAHARLRAVDFDGRATEIPLPGIGSARGFPMPPGEPGVFFMYSSFDRPTTTFRYDLARHATESLRPPTAPIDPADLETRQVFYRSKDGTRIPMFVVHRKGVAFDGSNPTWLTAYGGARTSETPDYDPVLAWWLAKGGVVAVANIRGGSEYGDAWAKAAEKTHRQTSFDDFIAAAEWLIAQRITRPGRLAIGGTSNGGLVVAVAAMERPELFGAVVVRDAVLDMLRFHTAGQGEGWEGVYGSPEIADEFRALRAYSPVHNAKPARYPAMLVVTGDSDARVAPWHSYKLVAALQAAQRGPAPILLDVETAAGHGGATTVAAHAADDAAIFAFVRAALNP